MVKNKTFDSLNLKDINYSEDFLKNISLIIGELSTDFAPTNIKQKLDNNTYPNFVKSLSFLEQEDKKFQVELDINSQIFYGTKVCIKNIEKNTTNTYFLTTAKKNNTFETSIIYTDNFIKYRASMNLKNIKEKVEKSNSVKIQTVGDSLTFSMDPNSNNQVDSYDSVSGAKVRDGAMPQSEITVFDTLEKELNKNETKNKFEVIPQAACGYTTSKVFLKYHLNGDYDISTVMLGTNDFVTAHGFVREDFNHYELWYRYLIRRLIYNGSIVILIIPPCSFDKIGVLRLSLMKKIINDLGKEYNLPVVDMNELMLQTDQGYYSDFIHLKPKGYELIGKTLAYFIKNGNFEYVSRDNKKINERKTNFWHNSINREFKLSSNESIEFPIYNLNSQVIKIRSEDNGDLEIKCSGLSDFVIQGSINAINNKQVRIDKIGWHCIRLTNKGINDINIDEVYFN